MKRLFKILLSLCILLCLCGWVAWGNTAIEINEYTIKSERLPSAFSGFRIAQVSDLHNAEFGEDNGKLLEKLESTQPNVIVLTGDLIDSRRTNIEVSARFASACTKLAPTYYVSGNHESRGGYAQLKDGLLASGVTVLENQETFMEKDGERIRLIGVVDPDFRKNVYQTDTAYMQETLSAFSWGAEYTVLLSHRPELFDSYVEVGADLVFSGHAHGGQFRIPFLGGLFAPDQGFLPKYDAGLYQQSQTSMFVSRGIGNSLFPFRVNNRPEIIVVTLSNA
jgi:predicted MPP superfamily phosphohydrolase